jgi:hypothetical protein
MMVRERGLCVNEHTRESVIESEHVHASESAIALEHVYVSESAIA